MSALQELATGIAAGRIRVVDLTQTLSPEFPSISLPPKMQLRQRCGSSQFAKSRALPSLVIIIMG